MDHISNTLDSLESNKCSEDASVSNIDGGGIASMDCNNKTLTGPKELSICESKRFLEIVKKCQDCDLLSNEADPFDPETELDCHEEESQKHFDLLTFKCPPSVIQDASKTCSLSLESLRADNMCPNATPIKMYTEAPPDKECFLILRKIGNLLLQLQNRQVRNMQLKEDSQLAKDEKGDQYKAPPKEYYMIAVHRAETDGSLNKCILQALPFLKVLDVTKSALVWTPDQECNRTMLRKSTSSRQTTRQSLNTRGKSHIPTKSIIDIHLPNPSMNSRFSLVTPLITNPIYKKRNSSSLKYPVVSSSALTLNPAPMHQRSKSYSKLTCAESP